MSLAQGPRGRSHAYSSRRGHRNWNAARRTPGSLGTLASWTEALASTWIAHEGQTLGYGIGDALEPGVEVLATSPGEVVLDLGSRLAILHLEDQPVAPGHKDVRREDLESVMREPSKADLRTGLRQHKNETGEVDGFELTRVVAGSTLEELGLQKGDVVHRVNGQPIRSQAEALGVLQDNWDVSEVEVDLTREGAELLLTFDVH